MVAAAARRDWSVNASRRAEMPCKSSSLKENSSETKPPPHCAAWPWGNAIACIIRAFRFGRVQVEGDPSGELVRLLVSRMIRPCAREFDAGCSEEM